MKRSQILQQALDRQVSQRVGVERLCITPSHFRRLLRAARQAGPLEAVVCRRCGRPSHRAIPAEVRAMQLSGFRP